MVAVAGAHGNIAMRLIGLLTAEGEPVVGLIRNPEHAADVSRQGADSVVCDLEHAPLDDIEAAIQGVDAVVFAAGAGPGSGAERKLSMDRDGAIKLLAAAEAAGVQRYVIVSAVGAEDPPPGEEIFNVYLRAKAEADAAVKASPLDWTIVRPGRLTDEPGTGRVRLAIEPFRGEISRDDIAAVLARVLSDPRATGLVLYVNSGDDTIEEALEQVLAA
jgi:uncharacterized protein YbjT (DUF2867 family)